MLFCPWASSDARIASGSGRGSDMEADMVILRMKRAGALAALLWAMAPAPAGAVPPGFNIQGRLTDANGVNREGNYSIKFTLYDAPTGGTAIWTRTYTALTVRNGNFQTVLGDTAGQPMLTDVFATGDTRHLEIQVLSGPGVSSPEQPLVPRQQLVSVPYAMKAAVADSVLTPGVPTGTVFPFASNTPPSGFVECDGAAISRTTYAALFSAIGTRYGGGDGSTTFNLPDLRGSFVRGWSHGSGSDPDAASRVASKPGGATGDQVGSAQSDQLRSHTHTTTLRLEAAGGGGYPNFLRYGGSVGAVGFQSDASGGSESRPKNISLMYIIKI
ncbi:MAG: tail fiber protein [Elusimicrobia bacterium]|nr:tail fiber protein [Elusimicrobiota bacterium]